MPDARRFRWARACRCIEWSHSCPTTRFRSIGSVCLRFSGGDSGDRSCPVRSGLVRSYCNVQYITRRVHTSPRDSIVALEMSGWRLLRAAGLSSGLEWSARRNGTGRDGMGAARSSRVRVRVERHDRSGTRLGVERPLLEPRDRPHGTSSQRTSSQAERTSTRTSTSTCHPQCRAINRSHRAEQYRTVQNIPAEAGEWEWPLTSRAAAADNDVCRAQMSHSSYSIRLFASRSESRRLSCQHSRPNERLHSHAQ